MSKEQAGSVEMLERWAHRLYNRPFGDLDQGEQGRLLSMAELSQLGIEEVLRRERQRAGGRLLGDPFKDVRQAALEVLLPELFWGLLVKHARWLLARQLGGNSQEAAWKIFENLQDAIEVACLTFGESDDDTSRKGSVAESLQSGALKITAWARRTAWGPASQPRIVVTDRPLPPDLASDDDALEVVIERAAVMAERPTRLLLRMRPNADTRAVAHGPVRISVKRPDVDSPQTALDAYVLLLFQLLERMAGDHRRLVHRRYTLLRPPERLWATQKDLDTGSEPTSLTNYMLRYLCTSLLQPVLGPSVAWVFAPHPRASDVLTLLAGSEPYPIANGRDIYLGKEFEQWRGLTGRSWLRNRTEISLDAQHDSRVVDAAAEGVYQCLATPLTLARPELPGAGQALSPNQALWLCKVGVLYVGVRQPTPSLKHHHILLLRHFAQIMASYVATVLFAEYARASIVEDLRVGYVSLLDWIHPDDEWFRDDKRSTLVDWIRSKMDKVRPPDGRQQTLPEGQDSRDSDRVAFVLIRLDQIENLSRPPHSEREAARMVHLLKEGVSNWLDSWPLLKAEFRDLYSLSDYEHHLLVTVVGLPQSQVTDLAHDLLRWCNLTLSTKQGAIADEALSASVGALVVSFKELKLLAGMEGGLKTDQADGRLVLKRLLWHLKSSVERTRNKSTQPVCEVFDSQTVQFSSPESEPKGSKGDNDMLAQKSDPAQPEGELRRGRP